MRVVRADEHEADISHVFAAREPRNVLEHVVAIVRLAVVHFLEEFDPDSAAPVASPLGGEPEPDVYATASVAAAP